MDGSYIAPDIFNFVQRVFIKCLTGESYLPAVMRVHDNSCSFPFLNILKDFLYPP